MILRQEGTVQVPDGRLVIYKRGTSHGYQNECSPHSTQLKSFLRYMVSQYIGKPVPSSGD